MILIVTPLEFEKKHLLTHLGTVERESHVGEVRVSHLGPFAVATGGHGKVQFALTSQWLLRELHPRLLVCAGACGALSESLQPLDVVVATRTIEHDFNLRFISRPPPAFDGDGPVLAQLRAVSAWPDFAVHFDVVASGDEDIIEAERGAQIRARTAAAAVAWEGAGGARSARFCATPYLEVRLVTDAANAQAAEDFNKNVSLGMKHVAHVLRQLKSN